MAAASDGLWAYGAADGAVGKNVVQNNELRFAIIII